MSSHDVEARLDRMEGLMERMVGVLETQQGLLTRHQQLLENHQERLDRMDATLAEMREDNKHTRRLWIAVAKKVGLFDDDLEKLGL